MSGYRYGFNGKENDNEVKGEGAQQDYGMRIYDPRIGKFLSVDPLSKKFPWYTPYQFAGNTPIQAIDIDGGEPGVFWLMDKYLEWKFGDPTGIKTMHSGIEQQIAIETRSTAYHNDKVPEKDQAKLDVMYKRQADRKVLEGSVQHIKFQMETALDVTMMVLPVEKGVMMAGRGIVEMTGNRLLREAVTGAFGATERAVIKSEVKFAYEGMEYLDDAIRTVDQPLVRIDPKRVDHIFGDRTGHLPNTPENVQLLENTANNKLNVLGPDRFGNQWSEYLQADGSQIWTQARDGKIINGGINKIRKPYNPETGLSAEVAPNAKVK